ncbi:MAG: hypothetical protein H6Q04_2705, partial [Acidobacteria bacterium]|nr:hypothetical protein [Acidobacteriota bacterium]
LPKRCRDCFRISSDANAWFGNRGLSPFLPPSGKKIDRIQDRSLSLSESVSVSGIAIGFLICCLHDESIKSRYPIAMFDPDMFDFCTNLGKNLQLLFGGFFVCGIGLFGNAGFGALKSALADIDGFIHEIPELFLVFFFSDCFEYFKLFECSLHCYF